MRSLNQPTASASVPVRLRLVFLPLLATLAAVSPAHGQVVALQVDGIAQSPNDPKRPFVLPAQSTELAEALEEFTRYSKRAAWDRAFKSLQKVLDANPTALVPAQDGFMLSLRARLWQMLAELPADGKDAYRLFYDAEAKKLLEEATAAQTTAPKTEQEKLAKLFASYFATSVGDAAADRLGDLYFEQGDYGKAAECWQAVLDYRPDSAIPRVTLLTKTAIALARGARWRDFHAVQHAVLQRHAGETVTLGGREVDSLKHLAALAQPDDWASSSSSTPQVEDLALGASTEPLWQFRYFPETVATAIARARQDWGPQSTLVQMIPPAALDGSRLYVNVVGHHLALDLASGKLLWRSARYHDIGQRLQNQPYYVRPEQYAVVASGGRAYFVSRGVQHLVQQNATFRLLCLSGEDGTPVWSSETVNELKEWSFCGVPLIVPGRLFACAYKPGKATDLYALALEPQTGKLLWSTLLGTHQFDPQQLYYQRAPQPTLAVYEGKLYVETHCGALVELAADTGTLNWAFTYDSAMPNTSGWWGYSQESGIVTRGSPVITGGVLYSKGMRSPRLYALQLAGPKLLWQRPVSASEMLVAIDGARMILTGDEVTAIGLENQRLQWSARLPAGSSELRLLVTRGRVYQFTPRGIYELDKATGDSVRREPFRGVDLASLGGALFLTPNALVSVSNTAVTAYPLQPAAAASAATSSEAASANAAANRKE